MTPVVRDPLLGQTVGNVRILTRLGAGAMGVVYKGFHGAFSREVAIKFLTVAGANSRERFLREGRAAARVDHPHVVKVVDAGEHQGKGYLVLEFVNGRSIGDLLDAQLEQDRSLPPTDRPPGSLPNIASVLTLGEQMCRGLHAIHQAGIVHRDIKPDNVLVSQQGQAKIADLGLAKAVEEPDTLRLTGTGMVVGTPLYVSPEGIRDPQLIGPPADIYSLGGTLYQMLAGRPPFLAPTAYEVMRAHLEEKPVPLQQLRPGIPTDLARLIERCLDKKPERRPTPQGLAEALARVGSHSGRGIGGLLAVTGIATVLAAGTFGGMWLALKPREAVPEVIPPVPIRLLVNHPLAEVRVDQGSWGPLTDGQVLALPGLRQVSVRVLAPGPRLEWNHAIEVTASDPPVESVTLAPIPVAPQRHTLAGQGMAYRNGDAVGQDSQLGFDHAGEYHLGRWDGALWRFQTLTIDERGQAVSGPLQTADRPSGPAWWRTTDERQQPQPPHHVPCWWEIESARARRRLPTPPGWLMQNPAPHDPGGPVTQLLISPLVDELAKTGGRLPDEAVATRLAAAYRTGVWSAGSPPVVVGAPIRTTGRIILVP